MSDVHSVRMMEATKSKGTGRSTATSLPLQQIVEHAVPILKRGVRTLFVISAVAGLYIAWQQSEYLLTFAIMSSAAIGAIGIGLAYNRGGLPILAAFAFQHGVTYAFPLVRRNVSIEAYQLRHLVACGWQFAIFIACAVFGWFIGTSLITPKSSRYFLLAAGRTERLERRLVVLSLSLLSFAFFIELLLFTAMYWSLFGNAGARAISVVRTFSMVSGVTGGFLGGFAGRRTRTVGMVFWLAWTALIVLLISSVLLSAATGLIAGTCVGLFLGGRRVPWIPMVVIGLMLGFLNQGKSEIRKRYWGTGNQAVITLSQLPGFYVEWINASTDLLFHSKDERERHSLADRINNLENLLFINQALTDWGIPSLNGENYFNLPYVVIPRAIWPEKPRTHEGQVLLNLHFRRQGTEQETFQTYIAWGLLPEACGNLGLWLGPLVSGVVLGIACGCAESWSRRKDLISIEGLGACIVLIYALISFEMTIGVLLALLFQTLVVVVVGGAILRELGRR